MPQPESWSSDWRMIGFSASINSWRIETASAATQPKTLHMEGESKRAGGEHFRLPPSACMEPIQPPRIWWARPRKLCALERPGGGGRSHRPERREAEIEYLKDAGVRVVISLMSSRHNFNAYEQAGLDAIPLPVDEDADGLLEALELVRGETRRPGAVAIHANRYTDFVAAVCAAHLRQHRGTAVEDSLERAMDAGLVVTPASAALVEADPDWIAGLLAAV